MVQEFVRPPIPENWKNLKGTPIRWRLVLLVGVPVSVLRRPPNPMSCVVTKNSQVMSGDSRPVTRCTMVHHGAPKRQAISLPLSLCRHTCTELPGAKCPNA